MPPSVEQLVEQIHASRGRLVLALSGGGTRAIAALLATPGGSQTVYVQLDPSQFDPGDSMPLQDVGTVWVSDDGTGDELEIEVRVGIEPSVTGFDFAFGCLPVRASSTQTGQPAGRAAAPRAILVFLAALACLALRSARRPSRAAAVRRAHDAVS